MKTWLIDPETRDYRMHANGTPVETDSLLVPAYIRLRAPRRRWMYAPDPNWGSDFWRERRRHQPADGSRHETLANQALQPLLDSGRATAVDSTADLSTRTASGLRITVTPPGAEPETLVFSPIL